MRKETKQAFVGPVLPTVWGLVGDLERSLGAGETVLAAACVTVPKGGGIVAVTNRKVVIRGTGARSLAVEYPLRAVSAMTVSGNVLVGGKLTVSAADGAHTVGVKPKTGEVLVRAFQDAQAGAQGQGAPVVSGGSVADELAKLGDLLDRGLITREEFDAKKTQLL